MKSDWSNLLSQPKYGVRSERNQYVATRDGTRLAVDVYRPDAPGRFPALLSYSCYGKDVQKLPVATFPSDSRVGNGGIEAGDTEFFVSRGYAHIIADARGIGSSEGGYRLFSKEEQQDGYDLVEWIARQPWCDGNVGMMGMSYFAMIQYLVAALNPPHLKAIFGHDALTDMYRSWAYHGGILNFGFTYEWWTHVPGHTVAPLSLSDASLKQKIDEAMGEADVKSWPNAYITLMVPEKNPPLFDFLIFPGDGPYYWERSAYPKLAQIKVPTYILSRWDAWTIHLPGAFSAYQGINAPKKLRIAITEAGYGFIRPWRENHELILRWYDHWLKGIDTGIMEEPPVSLFIRGIDQWRYEHEWPLARTKWTKFYLGAQGRLGREMPAPEEAPDSFTNSVGLWPGQRVPSVKYATSPLDSDLEATGPLALYLHATLSTPDANWMVEIHDVDTAGSAKLVTMGWLKASHREIDQSKSKVYQPYHPHTGATPVTPGEMNEYAIAICETAYVFKAGHRIQLTIKGQDAPWEGPERFRLRHYHLNNSRETIHTIFHTSEHASYLLVPAV